MAIPFGVFRQAELKDGVHVVTLMNGQQLQGKLVCTLTSSDDRKYDLRTATKLVLKGSPKDRQRIQSRRGRQTIERRPRGKPEQLWQLHITKPVDLVYSVSNPRFAFQYYSTSGYLIGGADRRTESSSFYLQVGDEEIMANLPDFQVISFDRLTPKKGGVRIKTTLRSKSGVETSGTPILKAKDDKGYHTGRFWFLVMDLANSGGVWIVLSEPNCRLTKVSK